MSKRPQRQSRKSKRLRHRFKKAVRKALLPFLYFLAINALALLSHLLLDGTKRMINEWLSPPVQIRRQVDSAWTLPGRSATIARDSTSRGRDQSQPQRRVGWRGAMRSERAPEDKPMPLGKFSARTSSSSVMAEERPILDTDLQWTGQLRNGSGQLCFPAPPRPPAVDYTAENAPQSTPRPALQMHFYPGDHGRACPN